MSEKRKKCKSVTNEQKVALIDFMQNNKELQTGKHTATYTQATAMQLWQQISSTLNSIPGPIKDWKAWRRTWQDLKTDAKRKQANINKSLRGTGGGPATAEPLDKIIESVVGIVGVVPISGDPEITESQAHFEFNDVPPPPKDPNPLICIEVPSSMSMESSSTHKMINDQYEIPLDNFDLEINSSSVEKRTSDHIIQEENTKKKCETKKQRLEKTVTAVGILGEASNERNEMMKRYYEVKLECLKKMVTLKERSTIAKERMCVAQEKIADALSILSKQDGQK